MYTLNLYNSPQEMKLEFTERHKSRAGALASIEHWVGGNPPR